MSPADSEAIRIARVLCITLVMYVHVSPGMADVDLALHGVRAFDAVRFTWVNSLGRASVGLLSVLSGWLAVQALERAGFRSLVEKRARTLLLPMALWSVIVLALAVGMDRLSPGTLARALGGQPDAMGWVNALTGLSAPPANAPLAFLRDMFACTLMLPGLLMAARAGWGWLMALALGVWAVSFAVPVMLTPNIVVLFAIGVGLGVRRTGGLPRLPGWVVGLSAVLVAGLGIYAAMMELRYLAGGERDNWMALQTALTLVRLPSAVVLWWAACVLVGSRWGERIARMEPFIFFVFCSHLIVLSVMWAGWERVVGGYYAPLYPVWFWLSPLVCLGVGWAGVTVLRRLTPSLLGWLNGGR